MIVKKLFNLFGLAGVLLILGLVGAIDNQTITGEQIFDMVAGGVALVSISLLGNYIVNSIRRYKKRNRYRQNMIRI